MIITLKGKRALVCGSTQGIGKAAAIELALLGASITLLSRDESRLARTVAELDRAHGQQHDYEVADFNNAGDVASASERIVSRHDIDILVNNTGGPPGGPAIDAAAEDFINAYSSHLIANHILAQAVVPAMKRKVYGRIINVISTSVKIPIMGLGVSNTTRGAVASWAKTLSLELASFGITVNNVLPGSTMTSRIDSIIQDRAQKSGKTEADIRQQMISEIPAKRMADAGEIGAVIAFLASPAAGYVNGVSLPVDGGRTGSI